MPSHPNRGRKDAPPANPKPEAVRRAREKAGLSRKDAAELIYASERGWIKWETGERRMHPGLWELFRRKVAEQETA